MRADRASAQPSLDELLAALAFSPELYPQKLDLVQDVVILYRFDEAAYRRASFLDDRSVTQGMQGYGIPFAAVAGAMASPIAAAKPLHYIFHSGHVGSTLLARLLEAMPGVLALKEPLPLRTLAEAADLASRADAFLTSQQLDEHFRVFLDLWARGFETTRLVVLKATSSAARVAPQLMLARPVSRCVYLNLAAEPYLATLLAGPNSSIDLRGHGQERIRRLEKYLGEAPKPFYSASLGELAAMSWLAERLTEGRVASLFGSRVLRVDFAHLLENPGGILAQTLRHFGIEPDEASLEAVLKGPTLKRYSKAPEHAYSRELRDQLLAQARRERGDEIRKGMALLEQTAARRKDVAAVL